MIRRMRARISELTMKPTIEKLNADEREWLESKIDSAPAFVAAWSELTKVSLESLDRAYSSWSRTVTDDTDEVNEVINVVGLAFGDILVRELGFKWVVSTDDCGTELAILALPGRGDFMVHPADFVAKRWERDETHFFVSSFAEIRDRLAAVAKMHGAGTLE